MGWCKNYASPKLGALERLLEPPMTILKERAKLVKNIAKTNVNSEI